MAKALGRGLGALLPGGSIREERPRTDELPLESLRPNPRQPRREFSPESLESLALSLGQHGVLEPLLVRVVEGGHEIVAGERRWQAAKLAGLETVPVRVVDVDDDQLLEVALVENLQREDLTPLEIAEALQSLIGSVGLTQEEVARRLGWNRTTVTNKLRLLQLPAEIRSLLASGDLTEGHGRALLGLDDDGQRLHLARLCRDRHWSVRELERAVQKEKVQGRPPKRPRQLPPQGERLEERYGLTVAVTGRGRRRSLRIGGLAEEEVQALLDLIDQRGPELFPGK
ncbi:MAG: ParB/RepB/Spo0J family partition protein [Synergistaceae bacterium]|nr:ParB/RepB/Spo0J family partition protein [Synergistaceae bacterium]